METDLGITGWLITIAAHGVAGCSFGFALGTVIEGQQRSIEHKVFILANLIVGSLTAISFLFNFIPDFIVAKKVSVPWTILHFMLVGGSCVYLGFLGYEYLRGWWNDWWPTEIPPPQAAEAVEAIEPEKPTNEPVPPLLPHNLRTEHMLVLARSGAGKTELLKHLILNDLHEECTIVVIDSQPNFIESIIHVVPHETLTHLTPSDTDYPLALNLFAKDQDSSLMEYIFASQEQKMTPNQATVYRMVSRLVAEVGGNLDTMRQMLEPKGTVPYHHLLDTFPPHVQSFFRTQYDTDKHYIDARQAILRRINGLLEVPSFAPMFSAKESKVDMAKLLSRPGAVLIHTDKGTLKGEAFAIFGRFFIAQISRAIFSRKAPYPHRVYLYIDEFQEYAGEEGFIVELFSQARKYNVGIIVAFQAFVFLPDKVKAAILSNTAIKAVGMVSAADARAVANEMMTTTEGIQRLKKGEFAVSWGPGYPQQWLVPFGRMDSLGKRTRDEMDAIRHMMRERYSRRLAEPDPKRDDDSDPDDVPEAGDWKP